ncbi:tRNA lysidine(34) synthetase TilS [Sphingomonas sp.]|uniref:tRNA lysidine(34) synthetase TilS n=1 Tax=Sphingomonas sp. TaxID=28214 RepID=UPI0035C85C16
MRVALDPAAIRRFGDDLSTLFDVAHGTLLVAVSGGPDSVALLLLAHALLGKRCRAATVDHGLRAEAAGEAAWVATLCATRGIAHATLSASLPERAGRTRNLSSRARKVRYDLLGAHAAAIGASAIATAHHADDQVETLVMRLNRGAGLTGLSGVRARSGAVIRPLLGWRRAELAALVRVAGITPVDDPTNRDARFDRARVRASLADATWIAATGWSRSAQALNDAEEALDWVAEQQWRERCRVGGGEVVFTPADLPFDLRRRLVARCVDAIEPGADPRGGAVAAAVASLGRGYGVTLGNVLCRATRGACDEAVWRFVRAPARRSP